MLLFLVLVLLLLVGLLLLLDNLGRRVGKLES
jgi:hypothetical protein